MTASGRTELAVDAARLRSVLGEPDTLSDALPNVTDFAWIDESEGRFSATIRPEIALGEVPVRTEWLRLPGTDGEVRYEIRGRTDEHLLAMDISLRLEADGDGTVAKWTADFDVTGTMRSVGQRVLPAVVAHQVKRAIEQAAALV
jgi:carbon monoxide dehydrogenase subunit G